MVAVTKRNRDGELASFGDIDLAHEGDVAVERATKVPGHAQMRGEIRVAVAGADIAATGAGEAAVGTEGEGDVVLPGKDAAVTGDVE